MNEKRSACRRNLNATVAKMHAVYGRRLRQEDYNALLSCTSVSDAADYLKRSTYFSKVLENVNTESIHRGNLENILRRSLMERYFQILRFEKIAENEFYNFIIIKTEIDEILICILHLNAGTSDHINTLPIYMNKYTSFNLMELAKVGSYAELLALTEKTPYSAILKKYQPDEKGHIDYPALELELNTYYSRRLAESLKLFGGETEKRLRDFIGSQIDIKNIINSYRMKRFFNADAEDIRSRMIPIYMRISQQKMDELYNARDDKEFMQRFSQTYYGREIAAKGFDMSDPETALIRFRYLQIKRAFSRSTAAPECFYTFIQLADIEVKNIIRIIEGIRYSLPTKEISELIIT